jgi:hypothetical protein
LKESTVVDQPDYQGPGEDVAPDGMQAEASDGPIPNGEMLGADPAQDPRRFTLEMRPVDNHEPSEIEENRVLRRTGTDSDALRSVRVTPIDSEQRCDNSADNDRRENMLDPAQDDVGPQSDQG